jgi:hypothetical protein
MKLNKSIVWAFIIMVIVAALYRIIPNRPAGFAPQMALALFGGAMIADKKWAFALPLFSLFISDLLYHVLFISGLTNIKGFYDYQLPMYICFMAITVFGFFLKKANFLNTAIFATAGSVIFFLLSNFFVWIGGFGFARPKTLEGLLLCYNDSLLFYRDAGVFQGFYGNVLIGDLFFTAIVFGGFYLVKRIFATQPAGTGFAN